MKYIKRFSNLSGQTEYLNSADIDTYLGYVDENDTVYYDDAIPEYKERYFTIKSLTDNNTIAFRKNSSSNVTGLYTSTDDGKSWSLFTPQDNSNRTIATLNADEKLLIKGENTKYNYSRFFASGQFEVYGNIMSLISGDSFANADTITDADALSGLFSGATTLTSAENLILPATILAESCYKEMFHYCGNLTSAPALPATTLTNNCYEYMFKGCTSLTSAPELSAATLTSGCYSCMFQDCSSLTTAPELPATTLVNYCYFSMFRGCARLNYIKCLATDISASMCTSYLADGVASTGTFVKAASMNDWTTGNNGIPNGWTVQDA